MFALERLDLRGVLICQRLLLHLMIARGGLLLPDALRLELLQLQIMLLLKGLHLLVVTLFRRLLIRRPVNAGVFAMCAFERSELLGVLLFVVV
jgi:hypothetical protein